MGNRGEWLISSRVLARVSRWLWAAVLVCLPVTSFRYFLFLGESTQVRPLALYPLVVLFPILLLRWWRGEVRRSLPGSLVVWAAFLAAAALSSAMGALNPPIPLRGSEYIERVTRAWVTAGIGTMFFVSAIWMNQDEEQVRYSARWLLVGLCLHFVWSLVQALSFYTSFLPRPVLREWQMAFLMRAPIKNRRFSGLAFEPSWLAGQLLTLYLPWLIAALLTHRRVFRERWIEPVLLVATVVLLMLTYSRGGIVYSLVTTLIVVVGPGRAETKQLLRAGWAWVWRGKRSEERVSWRQRVLTALIVAGIGIVAGGAGFLLVQKPYFQALFSAWERADTLEEYIIQNYAGGRAAYVWAALGVYGDHPWWGAGLGASGLTMYNHLPDFAKTTVFDIARQLAPDSQAVPNPKSMPARLLAETGLIGTALFLAFSLSLAGEVRRLLRSPGGRFFGLVGIFTWIAVLLYNMTQDSFATPNLWINLGILLGLANGGSASISEPKETS